MIILVLLYKSGQNHKNQGIIRAIFCKCPDIRALPGLGKPHHKNIAVHLGIARLVVVGGGGGDLNLWQDGLWHLFLGEMPM